MGLKLDMSGSKEGQIPVPEIMHTSIIYNQFVVKVNRGPFTYLDYAHAVPFPERFVSQNQGIFTSRTGAVVKEASGTFISTTLPFSAFLRVIPYLDLGSSSEIHT